MNTKLFIFLCFILTSTLAVGQTNDKDNITESSEPIEGLFLDDIVERTLVEENKILQYEPIREADISWEKRIWRVIDCREKMNLVFKYPVSPFFTILKDMAENGEITLFREEDFRDPLTVEDVDKILNRIDTVTTFNYDTYEEEIKIVRNEIYWDDINQYRMKEMWYFDEESSMMKSRILGIAPVYTEVDEETGVEFTYPLFWVYYPEAREGMARQRVFNEFNDIAPRSWYDLFEERNFASYIIKKTNPLDLRIKDMYERSPIPGIDALLESEKIKAELFNFEHDLWEY